MISVTLSDGFVADSSDLLIWLLAALNTNKRHVGVSSVLTTDMNETQNTPLFLSYHLYCRVYDMASSVKYRLQPMAWPI